MGEGCLGLFTLVLLLANSSLMVCGRSGSKRIPCCSGRQICHGSDGSGGEMCTE
mgnify:CR=1 FL=1